MHGIGNDYVYMDCTKEAPENPEELARLVSDRHKGIGADGLILIKACEEAEDVYKRQIFPGSMTGRTDERFILC